MSKKKTKHFARDVTVWTTLPDPNNSFVLRNALALRVDGNLEVRNDSEKIVIPWAYVRLCADKKGEAPPAPDDLACQVKIRDDAIEHNWRPRCARLEKQIGEMKIALEHYASNDRGAKAAAALKKGTLDYE